MLPEEERLLFSHIVSANETEDLKKYVLFE